MALQVLWDQLDQAYNQADIKYLAVTTLTVTSLLLALYRLFLHPLAHVPGPFLAKLTGLWRDAGYRRGRWHEDILEIHQKYGRVVRIAPNEVSVVDEWAMKNLYGHGHNALKTEWYSVWDPPQTAPQLFSALDKKVHGFLRKRVSGAYSMSSILKYEKYIQACLDLLLAKLHKYAGQGPVDMSDWTNAFAFDVVGELGYGSQLGMLRTETDVNDLRRNIFDVFKLLSCMGHFPGQMWIIQNVVISTLLKILGAAPPLLPFRTWTFQQVKDRLDHIDEVKREDMLQHFCRMKDGNGDPVKIEEVVIEAMNLM